MTLDFIQAAVSKITGVSKSALESHYRTRRIAYARHLYYYMAYKYTAEPNNRIIAQIGQKESTAINKALAKIGDRLSDPRTRRHIESLNKTILNQCITEIRKCPDELFNGLCGYRYRDQANRERDYQPKNAAYG
ncbi:helix-turn-helix domain-containing protein [Arachidicoccus terrestris]|uniref:helix-turn-helix domain-containing protein n=1 Tax=Arachidicoccus terrestris TaxID=2875539 RepID=UPI001CC82C41|nr:helix-turn-helix domain-containing protein [Arachidicoccus terrestris]UAY56238.1 hypothetical protein K9M52_04260 [Arachidicoccus terrestris]